MTENYPDVSLDKIVNENGNDAGIGSVLTIRKGVSDMNGSIYLLGYNNLEEGRFGLVIRNDLSGMHPYSILYLDGPDDFYNDYDYPLYRDNGEKLIRKYDSHNPNTVWRQIKDYDKAVGKWKDEKKEMRIDPFILSFTFVDVSRVSRLKNLQLRTLNPTFSKYILENKSRKSKLMYVYDGICIILVAGICISGVWASMNVWK
jgi:hypothetical protein